MVNQMLTLTSQGIEGPVQFSGSTPDLDDFTLRIVDGLLHSFGHSTTLPYILATGPDNNAVLNGPHVNVFRDRIGKSHLAGLRLQPGDIWKAKGKQCLHAHL